MANPVLNVYSLGGIFPVLMPVGGSYSAIIIISGFYGLIISALPTTSTGIIVDLLGINNLNSAYGKYFIFKYFIEKLFFILGALTFIRGSAALLGPPAAGFILDHFTDYSVPFTFSTVLLGCAFIINLLAWCISRHVRNRQSEYQEI